MEETNHNQYQSTQGLIDIVERLDRIKSNLFNIILKNGLEQQSYIIMQSELSDLLPKISPLLTFSYDQLYSEIANSYKSQQIEDQIPEVKQEFIYSVLHLKIEKLNELQKLIQVQTTLLKENTLVWAKNIQKLKDESGSIFAQLENFKEQYIDIEKPTSIFQSEKRIFEGYIKQQEKRISTCTSIFEANQSVLESFNSEINEFKNQIEQEFREYSSILNSLVKDQIQSDQSSPKTEILNGNSHEEYIQSNKAKYKLVEQYRLPNGFGCESIVPLSDELFAIHTEEDQVDIFKYSDNGMRIKFEKILEFVPDLGPLTCGIYFEEVFFLGFVDGLVQYDKLSMSQIKVYRTYEAVCDILEIGGNFLLVGMKRGRIDIIRIFDVEHKYEVNLPTEIYSITQTSMPNVYAFATKSGFLFIEFNQMGSQFYHKIQQHKLSEDSNQIESIIEIRQSQDIQFVMLSFDKVMIYDYKSNSVINHLHLDSIDCRPQMLYNYKYVLRRNRRYNRVVYGENIIFMLDQQGVSQLNLSHLKLTRLFSSPFCWWYPTKHQMLVNQLDSGELEFIVISRELNISVINRFVELTD